MAKTCKKIILPIIVLLALWGCSSDFNRSNIDIVGNGNVTIEDRAVSNFTKLNINGVFNVFVRKSNEAGVEVETDENVQSFIIVQSTNDGTLNISIASGTNLKRITKLNIYIDAIDLEQIDNQGVSDIETTTPFDFNTLSVFNNGVGSITLRGTCDDLFIRNNGVGSVNALELESRIVEVVNVGVGNVSVDVLETLTVTISGVGSVRYTGNPTTINSDISGIGTLVKI
ncbi:DUF2807 domain-containing protein [Fulvivirgaceae bacterium BMA10]|uniref:DUF2807 domain-containing protein n=1 Tax=Splendidivirga corallicola TaxID=3051826 RepID=A0ABT8KPJ3_9BACT|nr:DUF2807 domain-containing protein [Fulvivirgaceae bacterium BMA10]